jgi:ribose 5-phosphate isomerase
LLSDYAPAIDNAHRAAAVKSVDLYVKNDTVVGLGTGELVSLVTEEVCYNALLCVYVCTYVCVCVRRYLCVS